MTPHSIAARLWLLLALFIGLPGLMTGCANFDDEVSGLALTDAPKYGKFVWHDLLTDDVDAARAFYGPLLGWSFEAARRPTGGDYTLIRSAQGQVVGGIVEVEDPGDGTDYSRWLGYYAVPDVDAASDAFADAGGQVLLEPRDLAMVARAAVVRDPDGAVVGFVTSRIGYPIDQLRFDEGDVSWNELVTARPANVAALYAGLAAGTVREEARGEFTYWILHNEGRERAGVMQRPSDDIEPFWLTYFAVEDPVAAVARVAELGGTVLLEPTVEVRNGTIALVTDPTGAILGLRKNL
jgi:predicted enzyme related to lactoylglutathione lyase